MANTQEDYPDKKVGDSLEAAHINKLNVAARMVTSGPMGNNQAGAAVKRQILNEVMVVINSDDECDSGTADTGTAIVTGLKGRRAYWDDFNQEWNEVGADGSNPMPLDTVDPDVILGEGEFVNVYWHPQRGAWVAAPIAQPAYVAFGTIAGLTVEEGVAIPGKATLPIYKVCLDDSGNPELRQIFGKTLVVYNMQDQQISGRFTIVKGVLGKWFAAAACCLVVCCNLHAPAIADVVGCNCRVDLPLYNPSPMKVTIVLADPLTSTIGSFVRRDFPFARSPWVLGEDGEGFDNFRGQDVDYTATLNPPDDYDPFSSTREPSPIMSVSLSVNVLRQTIVDYFPQTEDTMNNTGYVGYNAYGHIPGVQDIRYLPRPLLENHPVSYGSGPGIRQFRYITNFSYPDPSAEINPNRAIIYTQEQLAGVGVTPFFAFYNSFNAFEIEVNIDEDSEVVLNVPPATVPAFNPEKTVQNTTEELYIEKIGDEDCTGTGTETTTQRRTIAITNTGDSGYFDGSSKFTHQIRLGIVEENEQSAWVLIRDVEIGSGNATITGARLIFTQKELSDESLFLKIYGVYAGNINGPPSTFAEYEAYPLWTSASTGDPIAIDWDIEGESNDGDLILSADVTSLIGAIVSRSDWESGQNIMLLIKFENSTGTGTGTDFGNRKFYSSNETEEEIEPIFEYEYESVEEVCEEFFLQMDCQTVPYELPTGTGTGTGDDTVAVRFISPPAPPVSNGRSKAWTTVVMEGDLYTCEWYAGYDGETEEEVLAQSPMVQGSLGMYRWEDGLPLGNITDAQLNRVPILPYSPPYYGSSPATIPMSRWFPVRAWAGSKANDPGVTGTDDEQFILPNGFDWRKMCFRTSKGPDSPYVMWFRDQWRESQRGFFADEYQCI